MDWLLYLSAFSIIPAALIALRVKLKTTPSYGKWLLALVISYLVIESIAVSLASFGMNNLPVYNLIVLLELSFLTLVFFYGLNTKTGKFMILFIGIGAVIYHLVYTLAIHSVFEWNGPSKTFAAFVYIVFALIWMLLIFQEQSIECLTKSPVFYLSTGILIYFSSSFFIVMHYGDFLEMDPVLISKIWPLHSSMNIIYNLFIAIAVWRLVIESRKSFQLSTENND